MYQFLSFAFNFAVTFMVVLGWVMMLKGTESGNLAEASFKSLKFFTVLSNIFAALASLIYGVTMLLIMAGAVKEMPKWIFVLRFMSVVAVAITFLTVMVFLGPTTGFGKMFKGSNLWFHMVVPITAILGFIFFDHASSLKFIETLFAVIPAFLYATFYLMNIIKNGKGDEEHPNDWYGFLNWGPGFGALIALIILTASWGMGIAFRALNLLTK